jgi:hypothetical protein
MRFYTEAWKQDGTPPILFASYNYHLFTETEGNSVFCGPETEVEGPQNTLRSFPEVSVNKCFIIYQ